ADLKTPAAVGTGVARALLTQIGFAKCRDAVTACNDVALWIEQSDLDRAAWCRRAGAGYPVGMTKVDRPVVLVAKGTRRRNQVARAVGRGAAGVENAGRKVSTVIGRRDELRDPEVGVERRVVLNGAEADV